MSEGISPYLFLWPALVACAAIGFAAPFAGAMLLMRRQILLAFALPPLASAAGSLLHMVIGMGLLGAATAGEEPAGWLLVLAGATATFLTMAALTMGKKKLNREPEGIIAVVYSLASGLAVVFVTLDPFGEVSLLHLFNGEAMAVGREDLGWMAGVFVASLAVGLKWRPQLVLCSFDPEKAILFGWKVRSWDLLLYGLIGVVLSFSVYNVGFLAAFALLLVPVLTVRAWAGSLRQIFIWSPVTGVLAALAGFLLACIVDWPIGPSCALASCALYFLSMAGSGAAAIVTSKRRPSLTE